MNRGEILERTGAQDWSEVEEFFGDANITKAVEEIWPGDPANDELAAALTEELAR